MLLTAIFVYTTIVNIIERPGRHQDRRLVHRRHHRLVARLARDAVHRDPHRGRRLRRDGPDLHPRGRGPPATAHHRQPAEHRQPRRSTRASCSTPGRRTTCDRAISSCFSKCGPATRRRSPTCCTCRASTSTVTTCCAARARPFPNAIAGLLLDLRDRTYSIPHAYFGWTEGNPIAYLLKFLAFGEGDTAPVCREVLRQAEPIPERRPRIHVG